MSYMYIPDTKHVMLKFRNMLTNKFVSLEASILILYN